MESIKCLGQPKGRPDRSLCCFEALQTVFGCPGKSHSILPILGLHNQDSRPRYRGAVHHLQVRRCPLVRALFKAEGIFFSLIGVLIIGSVGLRGLSPACGFF